MLTTAQKLDDLREKITDSSLSEYAKCDYALRVLNKDAEDDYTFFKEGQYLLKEHGFWIASEFCSWIDEVGIGETRVDIY